MQDSHRRTIRSFVKREGRLTNGQQHALDHLWPEFGIDYSDVTIDMDAVFGRQAERILEIGFGNGESLWQMASEQPDKDFIGIEVHRPGVGRLLKKIEDSGMQNLRLICHDAIDVLKQQITDNSLDRVQLFFPDPWHKKKHHKRRIVQAEFAELIAQKLKAGGIFHLATDWQHYAEHMLEVLNNCPQLQNLSPQNDFVPRPDERPLTKFERRGHRLGHGVWDLFYNTI